MNPNSHRCPKQLAMWQRGNHCGDGLCIGKEWDATWNKQEFSCQFTIFTKMENNRRSNNNARIAEYFQQEGYLFDIHVKNVDNKKKNQQKRNDSQNENLEKYKI